MPIVWSVIALLFFFSLVLVSFSVFTPRTAIFFKEKTKIRGAILWLSIALVCAVLYTELGPGLRPSPAAEVVSAAPQEKTANAGLPGYNYRIAENKPGERIVVECILGKVVDETTLKALALKLYAACKGSSYTEVYMNWSISSSEKGTVPWARTSFAGGNWSIRFESAAQS